MDTASRLAIPVRRKHCHRSIVPVTYMVRVQIKRSQASTPYVRELSRVKIDSLFGSTQDRVVAQSGLQLQHP